MKLRKHRVFGAALLGFVVMATAGCGAGQITQTSTQQPAVNGGYARIGDLSISAAGVANRNVCEQAYAAGSSAPLVLRVINQGQRDDELVAVNSDATGPATINGAKAIPASRVLVVGPAEQSAEQPGASASSAATTTSASSSTSSSAPQTSGTSRRSNASATSSATTTSTSSQQTPEVIGQASIVLQGLKNVLWPGQTIKVNFVFREAGSVSVDLPVLAPTTTLHCAPQPEHAENGGHEGREGHGENTESGGGGH